MPLAVTPTSEPEPDIAVVPGQPRDFEDHPNTAVLVVEVSDTTLHYDRNVKSSLYASAGVGEYWISNVVDRQLEVHVSPGPGPDPQAPFGHRYEKVTTLGSSDSRTPAAASSAITVTDMLA